VELTTWVMREIGRTLGAGRLMELHNLQHATSTALAQFHERWDLLLTATTAGQPARIGELVPTPLERVGLQLLRRLPLRSLLRQALVAAQKQLEAYPSTQVFNITGQPAISLPVHRTPKGLPVGVQLSARFGDEATLLRVAAQLEAELRWTETRPRFLERE
jgi:amidase